MDNVDGKEPPVAGELTSIHDRETLDELEPANDDAELPVIPAGQAQLTFSRALDNLVAAFQTVEALGMALARALDEQGVVESPR